MLAPSLESEARCEAATEADFADDKRLFVVVIVPSLWEVITLYEDVLTLRETIDGGKINIPSDA